MNKSGFIYIMTNKNKTTLYIGVTNDLCRRIYEHKNHLIKDSFTDRYNLEYCVYYEEFPYFNLAINREKELKKWNRQKKEDLINKKNPQWIVLVTEHGFVRNSALSSQTASVILNEAERSEETQQIPPYGRNDDEMTGDGVQQIPRFARNDGPLGVGIGGGDGGEAAITSTPSFLGYSGHSERSEESLNGEATLYSEQIEETANALVEADRHSKRSEEAKTQKGGDL